jgi:hypothetical protein
VRLFVSDCVFPPKYPQLEAEYWATLGPSEREAEERTAAGTKALTAGRFEDALADFDR